MKRTTSRRTIRLTESKLRQIIKSVLLEGEGGIPDPKDFPEEDYDREEVKHLNKNWKDPAHALLYLPPPDGFGFKRKEGPFDPRVVQLAADILSTDKQRCNPADLLIYLPKDKYDGSYDQDAVFAYADGFLGGVEPGFEAENMNGYVLLDINKVINKKYEFDPSTKKYKYDPDTHELEQVYMYTCKKQKENEEQEENNAAGIDQEKSEQLKTLKNKNLMRNENKMRRPTRRQIRLTESKLRQIIRSVINESYFG